MNSGHSNIKQRNLNEKNIDRTTGRLYPGGYGKLLTLYFQLPKENAKMIYQNSPKIYYDPTQGLLEKKNFSKIETSYSSN